MFRYIKRAKDKRFVTKFTMKLIEWTDLSLGYDVKVRIGIACLGCDFYESTITVGFEDKLWRFVDSGGKKLKTFPIITVTRKELRVAEQGSKAGTMKSYPIGKIKYNHDDVKMSHSIGDALHAIGGLLYSLKFD